LHVLVRHPDGVKSLAGRPSHDAAIEGQDLGDADSEQGIAMILRGLRPGGEPVCFFAYQRFGNGTGTSAYAAS
jgi:hypothetical protein